MHKLTPKFLGALFIGIVVFGYLLLAQTSNSQAGLEHRSLDFHFNLPIPKGYFELSGPPAAPVQQLIDTFQDITIPAVCPAPIAPDNKCLLGLADVGEPTNNFEVNWSCTGINSPCSLSANNKSLGQVQGNGRAFLNLDNLMAQVLTFNLKNAAGASCASQTAHTFKGNTSPQVAFVGPSATFTQSGYRWFANANSATPGAVLGALNTAVTVAGADIVRLRLLIHVSDVALSASGDTFKLQWASKSGTCAASTYTDVLTDVGGARVRYENNGAVADAAVISSTASDPTDSSDTVVVQTYEEANNFTNSTAAIPAGQDGLWDFAVSPIDNAVTYCLRVVKSDGTQLGTYSQYPEISTSGGSGF